MTSIFISIPAKMACETQHTLSLCHSQRFLDLDRNSYEFVMMENCDFNKTKSNSQAKHVTANVSKSFNFALRHVLSTHSTHVSSQDSFSEVRCSKSSVYYATPNAAAGLERDHSRTNPCNSCRNVGDKISSSARVNEEP